MMNSLRAAAFLSLVVGSISGLAVGIYQFQRIFAANVAEVRRDALLAVDTVELLVQNMRLAATTVAANIDPDDLAGSAEVFWQSVKQEWPSLRTMLVIDPSGVIVADLGRDGAAVGTDVSFRDYFLEVISGREAVYYVDAPIISTFDDRWVLPVSAPVLDENLGVQGVVTASVAESYFDPTGWQSLGQGSQVYLVSMETGGVAALQPDMPLLPSGESADAAVLEAMRGSGGRLAIPGQTAFGSVTSFGSLGVIVSRPSMAIRHLAIRSGAISGLLVAAAAAFLAIAILRGKMVLDRVRRDAARLTELQQHQRLATAAGGVGIWVVDVRKGTVVWDDLMFQQFGVDRANFGGTLQDVSAWLHPDDVEAVMSKFEAALKTGTDFENQYRIVTPAGEERMMRSRATITIGQDGKPERAIGVNVDVTQEVSNERSLRTALERIEWDASHDQLTGVGNRRGFAKHVEELARSQVAEAEMAVVLLDIDQFKLINDVYGHVGGDHLLSAVAANIRSILLPEDFLGRLGGDEFVVILYGPQIRERAIELSDRILEVSRQSVFFGDKVIRYTSSVGISVGPLSAANRILEDADIALYEAKTAGRNQAQIFNKEMRLRTENKKRLADDLSVAVENGQIGIRLQPQICAHTGALAGVEALVRWWHPVRGELSPIEFLPLASEIGVMADIDAVVMAEALKAATSLADRGIVFPRLSLNVSLERLIAPSLVSDVEAISSFDGRIIFELLEVTDFSVANSDVFDRINRLRDLGVQFAVDDFGSGHASLTTLLALEPDYVKIDKRLVIEGIRDGQKPSPYLTTIIELCQRMKISIVAEGVETQESANALTMLGVEFLQGYHFGHPLTLDEFYAWKQ
ncbi:bifunctional diguanylate cyclase/phosphodiesterase [Roseicyclus marinus]|uniref:bifunctional diguanylate cyclase/phosphodiesterase n=1 Tax=Roseicyclus marinus TaxID=2161673 RepID=UPI00240F6969|nr:EAL domain-containing protein [Roseicyclus marinus]MDG3040519.1 EAL domain-containing protein [Roseicyclus marinus]